MWGREEKKVWGEEGGEACDGKMPEENYVGNGRCQRNGVVREV